jgi:Zn-dependent protease with chaperone function
MKAFFREHAYGLSNQSFLQWLGDFGIQFALTFAACLFLLPFFYAVVRRTRAQWWIWGAGLAILFQIFVIVIWPGLIAPLFNHYSPLPESPLKAKILALARANDVPVDNVFLVDASRQSNRVSANVSGFLGTARISLNDNLLKQGSQDEVLAVMGHEMGHYVMGHVTRSVLLESLVILAGFVFINWAFWFGCDVFGGQWQVRNVGEAAGLPLLVALSALFLFLAGPATNSISRVIEYQADIFGLNAVRKPDAFAEAMLKLSTYRKLEPGNLGGSPVLRSSLRAQADRRRHALEEGTYRRFRYPGFGQPAVIDLKALNLQAMSALHYGELAQAEAIIAQLGDARPGHPQVVLLTGMLRAQQGRHDEAVLLPERLLKLRPQDTGILLLPGQCLTGTQAFNEALQHYEPRLR